MRAPRLPSDAPGPRPSAAFAASWGWGQKLPEPGEEKLQERHLHSGRHPLRGRREGRRVGSGRVCFTLERPAKGEAVSTPLSRGQQAGAPQSRAGQDGCAPG